MYEEIRNLAVAAVKLQNKLNMEATLIRIAAMCEAVSSEASPNTCDDGQISAGDVLVAADGQEFKVDAVLTASKKTRAKVSK